MRYSLDEWLAILTVSDGAGGRKLKTTTSGGIDDVYSILTKSDASGGRMVKVDAAGGGGTSITVVRNYSSLPDPTTVSGQFYWCEQSEGTWWLPGSLGGTYYNIGMYYSNGTDWVYMETPFQSTQIQVDAGINDDTFVTPLTLNNYSRWASYLTAATAASTYAPIASPTFTGTPSAPTAAGGTNTTQIATTAFVTSAVAAASAPFIATLVTGGTAVTGTTANTYSGGVLIPANTFVDGDCPFVICRVAKTGVNNTVTVRYYVNTANSLAGSPILMGTSSTLAANTASTGISRTMAIEVAAGTGNGTTVINSSAALQFDLTTSLNAQSSLAIDWTQDQYVIVAIQNASSADSSVVRMLKVTK